MYAAWTYGERGHVEMVGTVALILSGILCSMCGGFFWFVALVFMIIRQGRLRVDGGAVRWGWNLVSFRMPAERMASIRLYKDGASLVSHRRGAWHLLARDWERWSDVARALARLPVKIERPEASVPFMGRLQSYGRALDIMLVINSVAATLVFLGI